MIEIEFEGKIYNNLNKLRASFDFRDLYGPHITIDCDKCDYLSIVDGDAIGAFLTEFAREINMQIIGGPYCSSYKEEIRDPLWGMSGLLLIAESHIAIHTYPHINKNYALIDVFSCKYFDIVDAVDFVIKKLKPSYVFLNIVPRGSRFHILND